MLTIFACCGSVCVCRVCLFMCRGNANSVILAVLLTSRHRQSAFALPQLTLAVLQGSTTVRKQAVNQAGVGSPWLTSVGVGKVT